MEQTIRRNPSDWREGRRRRALELSAQGWLQEEIAAALGVTQGAVSQWLKRARVEGIEALYHRPALGPAPRLTAEQLATIPELLKHGAEYYGFRGDVWTRARVAEVIWQQFGVRYSPAHVSRLLRAVGWSQQKPVRRATQRDEAAIEQWRAERWPEIKKKR
jgi:transposase